MSRELPNKLDAEQSVIGACLDPVHGIESLEKIRFLKASDFFHRRHSLIFQSLLDMADAGQSIDIITLDEQLGMHGNSDDIGGVAYLADLAKNTPSHRNVVAYADIVRDTANRRILIALLGKFVEDLHQPRENLMKTLANASKVIDEIAIASSVGDVLTIDELIDITLNKMEESFQGIKSGIKTGIPEIDERLGDSYLARGEITVLGGLSKNGKTLVGNTISSRVDLDDNEVGHIFSIEMTGDAMFNAIISARTGVPVNFYRKQEYYAKKYPEIYSTFQARWGKAAQELKDMEYITIDAKKEVDADYICAGMKKQAAIARHNGKTLRYVMIDHLHRMNFHSGNSPITYAIRDAVRKIKNTAAELGVSVLLLAQLNNEARDKDPNSYYILDSSSVRHELQAFIGVRLFRENGSAYFGIYADSQRYADAETKHEPAYLKLINGVLYSLPESERYWTPKASNENRSK